MHKPFAAAALLLAASIAEAAPAITEQQLGQQLYSDKNLSLERNQSCATCHWPQPGRVGAQTAAGFVDPINVKNGSPVSAGSQPGEFGTLNAPSSGYAAFSPAFHLDAGSDQYAGGQFWNGRAADLADQAAAPLLNPAEMGMPSQWAVVNRLQENGGYAQAFSSLYGLNLKTIPVNNPNANPPAAVAAIYQRLTQAISAFEQTQPLSKFNSKYDFVLAGKTVLTALEAQGRGLFEGKAKCSGCHASELTTLSNGVVAPPLFSNYRYYNIGAPRNLNIPNNPAPDLGLGGRADIEQNDPKGLQIGKHKTMSLRNIAITPPYGHNGVFTGLPQIVHFFNTRDTLGGVATNRSPGFGVKGWPMPEVSENLDTADMGHLGLTAAEEQALTAFLLTLTDDYPVWGADPRVPPGTSSPFASTPIP